jgi:hypothetical protein
MRFRDPYDEHVFRGVVRPPRDEDKIRRTMKGRPYIKEIDILGNLTGKEVTYTRVTHYIDCVDDKSNLARWDERMLVQGLLGERGRRWRAEASANMTDDRKKQLNLLIKKIKESAGAEDKAAIGSAVHAITERYDLGLELGRMDEDCVADLQAYEEATEGLRHVHIERFMVNDNLQVAGTPDRIVEYTPCSICGSPYYIFDLKTGRVDAYTHNSHGMQISIYARSKLYDPRTGERTEPVQVCLHWGIVCALPAGSGSAELQWVDIQTGWSLVGVAKQVRKARNIKTSIIPFRKGGKR